MVKFCSEDCDAICDFCVSYKDDDYAQFYYRTYSDDYKCLDCGLYAHSDDKNDNYNLLKNTYDNKILK